MDPKAIKNEQRFLVGHLDELYRKKDGIEKAIRADIDRLAHLGDLALKHTTELK